MAIIVERPIEGLYFNTLSKARLYSSAAEHKARYEFVANVFIQNKTKIIGDMGCAAGESTMYLDVLLQNAGMHPEFIGIDLSKESIEKARMRNLEKVVFLSADLTNADIENYAARLNLPKISGIVFAETIEHIPPNAVKAALLNLRKLIEPDTGYLIITTPNRVLSSNLRYKPYNPFHMQEYNLTEFEEELQDAGYKITVLLGQRAVPKAFLKKLKPLQAVANQYPQISSILSKIMSLMILLKEPDACVKPFNKDTQEPKYFVAVCKV